MRDFRDDPSFMTVLVDERDPLHVAARDRLVRKTDPQLVKILEMES